MLANDVWYSVFQPPKVQGLSDDLQEKLGLLVKQWAAKRPRNFLRQCYVDMKIDVKNLGISIPDQVAKDLEVVSGWPEKAVHALASRCIWDGVVSSTGEEDPFGLDAVLHDNRFNVELPQAISSELTHSVSFITTTPGDTASGEPEVVILPHSAQWATALWDRSRRSLSYGLIINDLDKASNPCRLTLLTPFEAVVCETQGNGWYVSDVRRHGLKRVPMESLVFRPSLDRPFGRSRITRAVMTVTDRAIRAALRMDISSELYTAPGILLRGISEEAWNEISGSWTWKMGTVKGITPNEDGLSPEVSMIPQQSMLPYTEQIRSLAMEFASVASLPVSFLGIVQDNPASADAIYAAKEELVVEASNTNRVNGYALSRVYENAVELMHGESLDKSVRLSTRWTNPAIPSVVSQSDAMVKQISAIPELANTDVALEELGYSSEQIARIRSQIRRRQGANVLDEILASGEVKSDESRSV